MCTADMSASQWEGSGCRLAPAAAWKRPLALLCSCKVCLASVPWAGAHSLPISGQPRHLKSLQWGSVSACNPCLACLTSPGSLLP